MKFGLSYIFRGTCCEALNWAGCEGVGGLFRKLGVGAV